MKPFYLPPGVICPTCQGNRMIARVFFAKPFVRWIPCPGCGGSGVA